MVAKESPHPGSPSRLPIGLTMVAGLLVLRLVVAGGGRTFLAPMPDWVMTLFYAGTYLLNGALMLWERDRLQEFHVDRWALTLYILVPILLIPEARSVMLSWFQAASAGVLGLALLLSGVRLPAARRETLRWVGLAVITGVALGVVIGLLLRLESSGSLPRMTVGSLVSLTFFHLTRAASVEEPLFRGFLWGYLRQLGWQDRWIWLVQAALFVVGHLYHLGRSDVSFWVIVPLGGLVLGWIAWRSRSVGASMTVHALGNALGTVVGYAR